MKRLKIPAIILVLCLILSSCSKGGMTAEERAYALRELYAGVSSYSLSAEITADYGSYVYTYGIDYSGTADFGTAEVTSPDEISGLSAVLSDGGSTISFDGAELYMGKLSPDGLSPMAAIPMMLKSFGEGYVSGAVYESIDSRDTIAVEAPVSDTVRLTTWFDIDTNLPLRSEISSEGRAVIVCSLKSISTT